MTIEQMSLFPDLEHKPTVAETRGDSHVMACTWCGALVAVAAKYKLGPCPACGTQAWSKQPTECGPFRRPQ